MKSFVLICVLVLFAAHDAAAQGFIVPFIGTTLTSPGPSGDSTKPGYGVSFGGMGKIVGAETEIAYYPEVIDTAPNAIAKSRVISFSGGMLIGPRLGPVTPYFAIGAGNLNLNVTGVASVIVPNPESISNNYFTFNTGGGVMGYLLGPLWRAWRSPLLPRLRPQVRRAGRYRHRVRQVQFLARQLRAWR